MRLRLEVVIPALDGEHDTATRGTAGVRVPLGLLGEGGVHGAPVVGVGLVGGCVQAEEDAVGLVEQAWRAGARTGFQVEGPVVRVPGSVSGRAQVGGVEDVRDWEGRVARGGVVEAAVDVGDPVGRAYWGWGRGGTRAGHVVQRARGKGRRVPSFRSDVRWG